MIRDIREHSNDKMYQMRLQCLTEHVLTLKNELSMIPFSIFEFSDKMIPWV